MPPVLARFFLEARRRGLLKVATAYLIVSWLVLEIGHTLFLIFELPHGALQFVFVLLALGFPMMLVAMWNGWLGVAAPPTEGAHGEAHVEAHASSPHEGPWLAVVFGAVALFAVAVGIGVRFFGMGGSGSGHGTHAQVAEAHDVTTPAASAPAPTPAFSPPAHSIAVLPFVNMSGDPQQEYFSDGLSEELLNALVRVSELKVAARTSAFAFKKKDMEVGDIARRLNVAAILEGSVRKAGNKVRITTQLINAANGYHLWSQTYDRTLDDIFVVQDDIAREVVKALKLTLLSTATVTRSRPVDPEAYSLALQGRFFFERRGDKDLERAIDYFGRSRDRDPSYAPAWAGLSDAYSRLADSAVVPAAEGYERAREAAEKALTLDPQLADAHLSMGWIQVGYDWNWDAAESSFRKALELEPGNARALRYGASLAMNLAHWDEAIDLNNQAMERDPLRTSVYGNLGLTFLALHRDAEAEAAFRKALELSPDSPNRHCAIGLALLLQGKTAAALQEIQQETSEPWRQFGLPLVFHALGRRAESDKALAVLKGKYAGEMAYQIAQVHAFRGEADLAFEWLERAYAQRDAGVTEIKGDRLIQKVAGDPRYKAFLRKMKFPE